MTVIGITGGFCTGKTTATGFFKNFGASIIDADKIVHEIYRKDQAVKTAIMKKFGSAVFTGKHISREKLAKVVFKEGARKNLDALCRIIHPKTIKQIKSAIKESKKTLIVVDAPLLIETGLHTFVDRVLVVTAPTVKRMAYCKKKGISRGQFCKRSTRQLQQKAKAEYADFIIMNNMSKMRLKEEVHRICQTLKRG